MIKKLQELPGDFEMTMVIKDMRTGITLSAAPFSFLSIQDTKTLDHKHLICAFVEP